MKQRGSLMGLEPTISTLRIRLATYCATPPQQYISTSECLWLARAYQLRITRLVIRIRLSLLNVTKRPELYKHSVLHMSPTADHGIN